MTHYTEPTNVTGIRGIFDYSQSVTNSVLGPGTLFAFYLICVFYLKLSGNRTPDSFAAAGYASATIGAFFYVFGLVGGREYFYIILLATFGALWAHFSRE